MNYYYALNHQPLGPVPLEQLHELYRNGTIKLETLVAAEGGTEWKQYRTLAPAESASSTAPIPPPPQPAPVPQPAPAPASSQETGIGATSSLPLASAAQPLAPAAAPAEDPRKVVLISWILLAGTALLSIIPVVGCLTWVMFIPVFITTVFLGYLTYSRGGKRDGILILAASIVVLPAFTLIAPILTTALLGKFTDKGNKETTSKSTPARSAAPVSGGTTQPVTSSTKNASPAAASALSEDKDTRQKAIIAVINDFFIALDADQYEKSFDAASADFRTSVTKAEWVDYQRKNRLKYGKPTDHRTKTIDTNTDLTTGKKTFVVPVASTFEKGEATETVTVVLDPDGKYRVADYTFAVSSAAPANTAPAASSTPGLPSATMATLMVNNTMVNFKNAINSGNFEPFYRTQLSDRWKKETTPEKLKATFKLFVDKKVDLNPIFLVDPVLEPAPAINGDGLLILKGHYPLPQQKVRIPFELTYSREAKWGLSGINVKVTPVTP